MPHICKNCDHELTGNFCSHCGQTAKTHKLNMHYIWHEVQHGLIHVDHGIFYTIKQLLTVPGETIREFIDGKRVRHFKPVTLVVVLATVYGLLYHSLITSLYHSDPIHLKEDLFGVYQVVIQWTTDHVAYSSLILIVTNTMASYLVFRKQGYNFAEHLVLNTFYRALSLILSLMLLPVIYFYSITDQNPIYYTLTIQIFDIILMYWCYCGFFTDLSRLVTFGFTVLTVLLMGAINTSLGYLTGLVINTFL